MKKVRVVSISCNKLTGPPLHLYQIHCIINLYQTVWELRHAQDFNFRGDNYIMKKELSLLHVTSLLVLLFIPTKYYQSMSKGIKVMERTMIVYRFLLQGR